MAKLTVKLSTQRKQGCPVKCIIKCIKKDYKDPSQYGFLEPEADKLPKIYFSGVESAREFELIICLFAVQLYWKLNNTLSQPVFSSTNLRFFSYLYSLSFEGFSSIDFFV